MKIPIIFITGHRDIQMSVRAMKAGAVEKFSPNLSATRIRWMLSSMPLIGTGRRGRSGLTRQTFVLCINRSVHASKKCWGWLFEGSSISR